MQHLQERMLERQLQLRDRMRRAREREDKGEPEINWEDVERRIESAVEEGALSRELADAAYHGIKARLANARREYRREAAEERLLDGEIDGRTHDHFEALMDRIEHALDRGEISPDEAEAKREAVRERFERRERE